MLWLASACTRRLMLLAPVVFKSSSLLLKKNKNKTKSTHWHSVDDTTGPVYHPSRRRPPLLPSPRPPLNIHHRRCVLMVHVSPGTCSAFPRPPPGEGGAGQRAATTAAEHNQQNHRRPRMRTQINIRRGGCFSVVILFLTARNVH